MLGSIYQGYLMFFRLIGSFIESLLIRCRLGEAHDIPRDLIAPTYEANLDLDAFATSLGNKYRGFGVIGGFLSLLIFFLAILPFAMNFDEESSHWVGISEVILMVATISFFVYVWLGNFQLKWRLARKAAELRRYEPISTLIQKRDVQNLSIQISKIYDEQISYNQKKYQDYELIEKSAGYIMWMMFAVTMIAAGVHTNFHHSWLLLFTAIPPVLGGTIHGINGFLGIGELANDHEHMYKALLKLRNQFQIAHSNQTLVSETKSQEIINLADETHSLLTEGVQDWEVNIAAKQKLRPT